MKHEVSGQDDISIGVGTAGDRTIQIPIGATNAWLTNLDGLQNVMYADGAAPVFPADWNSLNPNQRLILEVPSGILSLRKRVFYRNTNIGEFKSSVAVNFQAAWDATANLPPLASGVGTEGDYYVVDTPGNTILDTWGNWEVGDWVIFNNGAWQKNEVPQEPADVKATVEVEATDV